jgi:hypothetical protein
VHLIDAAGRHCRAIDMIAAPFTAHQINHAIAADPVIVRDGK